MHVYFQNDRYTVGGKEIFDNLTDLVEHFKRTGIEELSGTMVYLKQVKNIYIQGVFIPKCVKSLKCQASVQLSTSS